METYNISAPTTLCADIALPASKSISNRALMIGALTEGGHNTPRNLSDCDDTQVMVDALRQMPPIIDIHGAGTAMRFLTAYLAATNSGTHILTGSERMRHRPIKTLVDALKHLGADIEYEGEEGFPPLRITGKQLEGGELVIAGNMSSQFVSALLMIGPVLKNGLRLRLIDDIVSRPYIDLTINIMHQYGAEVDWTSVDTITVAEKPYLKRDYLIESDWSAASYWYEMVALSSDKDAEVVLHGLADGSRQGDSSIRYIFSLLGVSTKFDSRRQGQPTKVTLRKNDHCLPRMEYDFTGAPDLAQTVVVTCCALGVSFRFKGLQTLRIKETDRIKALKTELQKLGYRMKDGQKEGELVWDGDMEVPQSSVTIDTYDDHRMAMAFAPLSLCRPIAINQPKVVSKSYPQFWDDLRRSQFTIESR